MKKRVPEILLFVLLSLLAPIAFFLLSGLFLGMAAIGLMEKLEHFLGRDKPLEKAAPKPEKREAAIHSWLLKYGRRNHHSPFCKSIDRVPEKQYYEKEENDHKRIGI